MSEPSADITLKRNRLLSLDMTLKDGDEAIIDLGGYTASMVIHADGEERFTLSTSAGGITLTAGQVENHINLTLTTAQTATMDYEHACGDLILTSPAGENEWNVRFNFKILQSC